MIGVEPNIAVRVHCVSEGSSPVRDRVSNKGSRVAGLRAEHARFLSVHRFPAECRRPHAPALQKPACWRFELLPQRLHASEGTDVFELCQCIESRDPSQWGDGSRRSGYYFQPDSLAPANVDDRVKFSPRSTAPPVGLNWSLARGRRLFSLEFAIAGVVGGFCNCLVGRRQSQRAAVRINNGR